MKTLLNAARPPVFCPGCAHERVVHALDRALQELQLAGHQVALVTDIGCSGLFDTFFNTHALHGLHGRALTYATGLKMARPEVKVITIMGDGGLGIGGAHVLAACRRNLDITLMVLNNFNYGMTGGQFSATTPSEAVTSSGFLNRLEMPLDICRVAAAAGAPWVGRADSENPTLAATIGRALAYGGFSLLEIRGLCTGRFTRRNPGARAMTAGRGEGEEDPAGPVAANERPEYGSEYRRLAGELKSPKPLPVISPSLPAPPLRRLEVLLLGAAGQRINTAGELLCLAAMTAGLRASQKNDYPITVLRGHSLAEVLLSVDEIRYTGIEQPDVILALAPEGVARRREAFARLKPEALVIRAADVEIPATLSRVIEIDFRKRYRIAAANRAVAALAVLSRETAVVSFAMLEEALRMRFNGAQLEESLKIVERVLKD